MEGGYNLVLPPLNGINQSGRGGQVGTDFVPTTNSSTNWNNENMTGQNQYTPANGRQFHDQLNLRSGLSRTSEGLSESNNQ